MPITVISTAGTGRLSGPVCRTFEPAHIIQVCCLSHLFCDIQLPQSVLEFNRNSSAAPLQTLLARCSLLSNTCRFLQLQLILLLLLLLLSLCLFLSLPPCANFSCISRIPSLSMLPQPAFLSPLPSSSRQLQLVRWQHFSDDVSYVWLSGYLVLDKLPTPLIGIDPEAVFFSCQTRKKRFAIKEF